VEAGRGDFERDAAEDLAAVDRGVEIVDLDCRYGRLGGRGCCCHDPIIIPLSA